MIILFLLIVMAIALCLIAHRVKPPLDPTKHRKVGLLIMPVERQQSERERRELELERREREREEAKWDRLRSEPLREPPKDLLPPMPQVVKQRNLVRPLVIGCMAVIALALSFVGVSYVIGTEPPALTQQVDYTRNEGRTYGNGYLLGGIFPGADL